MPARKKKKRPIDIFLFIVVLLLVLATILRFDVIADVVDPTGKMGLQNIANDAFPILLGTALITVGFAFVMSPWVAVGLIAVGVILVMSKLYDITQRKGLSSKSIDGE